MKCFKRIFSLILSCAVIFSVFFNPLSVLAKTTDNGSIVYVSDNASTFDPGGATYSRIIALKHSGNSNGTLLCTFDQLKNVVVPYGNTTVSKQVYPIYRSTDGGNTWNLIANVYDREYGLPKTSQPCLYELPQQVGDLPAGTILLAGNIFDDNPKTISRIVIYKSLDHGYSWSFLSQVDQGGPCTYDPSTTSNTTTVWEPYLYLNKYGDLVCYYSDERQKNTGALQTVSFKVSSDGVNWGAEGNVAAITNRKDRPGMITVTALPNGQYMATYEVVNRPSLSVNNAVVYCKFSNDGITWDAGSLGTRVALENGRGIGSSPYVKWVDAGGPNGMVIISAKWATDSADNLSGGQNFYANYNFGKGNWERLPFAVTYDPIDTEGGYFSGFSQSFDVSPDNTVIYQATNVENLNNRKRIGSRYYNLNDVVVGSIPSNGIIYEGEKANLSNVVIGNAVDASNGQEVRYINENNSSVEFNNVYASSSGIYRILIRYSNSQGIHATHKVRVNGVYINNAEYPETKNWDRYQWSEVYANLHAGFNIIKFEKNTGFAEIDCIKVEQQENAFVISNRNSGKYLECANANTTTNAKINQWVNTNHMCQKWIFINENGYYRIRNVNSGLYLDIENGSVDNGAKAVQSAYANSDSQLWEIVETNSGFFKIINKSSGKLLEVFNNLSTDGAQVGQWDNTGYPCQEWTLKREGLF